MRFLSLYPQKEVFCIQRYEIIREKRNLRGGVFNKMIKKRGSSHPHSGPAGDFGTRDGRRPAPSPLDGRRNAVEENALRCPEIERRQIGILPHVGLQNGRADRHVECPETVAAGIQPRERDVRREVELRQRIVAAVQPGEAPQPVEIEHRQVVPAAIRARQVRAHGEIQLRQRIVRTVEPQQIRELPQVGQRSDPTPGHATSRTRRAS